MKKVIITSDAPNPVGPYNQAILSGNTLYISGQIAIHPPSGKLITDDIESETHQVMQNISAILKAAGMTTENLVKCSIFVTDIEDYGRINKVYASYFNDDTAPARELVEVVHLPKLVNVEISGIAVASE